MTENNDASAPDATPTTVNEPVQLADQQPAFAAAPAAAAAASEPQEKVSHTRTILEVVGGVVAVGLIAVAGVTGFALGHLTSDKDGRDGRGERSESGLAMPGDRQEFFMPDQDDQSGPGMQGDQRGPGMQGDQRGPGMQGDQSGPGQQGGPGLQGGPGMVPGQNLEDLLQGLQEMLGSEGLQGLQDMLGDQGFGSVPSAPAAPQG